MYRSAPLASFLLVSLSLTTRATVTLAGPVPAPAAPTAAAPTPVDVARAKAEKGGDLYDAGQYEEAFDELSAAYAIVSVPTLELLLARCQVKLGKLLDARAHYHHASTTPLAPTASPLFFDAQRSAASELVVVEIQIPRIRLVVEGAQGKPVRVTVDGAVVAEPSKLIELDPGAHTIEVTGLGQPPIARKVIAVVGKTHDVVITLGFSEPPLPASAPATSATGKHPPSIMMKAEPDDRHIASRGPSLQAPGLALLGVGLAGFGVGAVTGVIALVKHDEIESRCDGDNGCVNTDKDAANFGKTVAMTSTVGLIVGGAAAATGAILLLVQGTRRATPEASPRKTGFVLHPVLGFGSISLAGEF